VINLTHFLDGELRLIFDCGTEDFFAEVNEALHQKLINEEVPHEYTIRPGSHNWDYWRNSIKYHLVFFDTFFHSSN
jgi:S-formylglutathione hydrolase FrmB